MITIQEYLLGKSNKNASVVIANDKNIRQLVNEAIKEHGTDVDLNFIDTSEVKDMYALFEYSDFCGDISAWDVRNVISMSGMFYGARMFNCDISDWDVRNVVNFESMFQGADIFNKPIGKWKTEKARNMSKMFYCATKFEQNLSSWHVDDVHYHSMTFVGSAMAAKKQLWPKFLD